MAIISPLCFQTLQGIARLLMPEILVGKHGLETTYTFIFNYHRKILPRWFALET